MESYEQSKEYNQWLRDRNKHMAQYRKDNRSQLDKDLAKIDQEFAIGMILLVPGSMALITIAFLLFIVLPYAVMSGLYEYNITNWIEETTEFVDVEYIDNIGDGNWSPSYFLYNLDKEKTAYNCWNKKSGGWRAINCKEVSLQEYEIRDRK